MKRESSTQSSFDPTFDFIDMLLSTPNDNLKARLQTVCCVTPWQPTSSTQLDDVLQSLQDVARACQTPDSDSEQCQPTSDVLYSPDVGSPQLDISLLNDMVLQELSDISSDLSFYTSVTQRNRRGSRVKRRLFSQDIDEDYEPSPKRQKTDVSDAWDSDDSLDIVWTFSDRRS